MLLDKYLSISLRLFDYTAAKILIISEISNYFMLTLLKDRVINGCFVIKDRVIKGCFVIKDRVIKVQKQIPAIGSLSYCRDFSMNYSKSSKRRTYKHHTHLVL